MFPIITKMFPGFLLISAVRGDEKPVRCEVCNRDGRVCSGRRELCERFLSTCAIVLVESTNWGKPKLRTVKTCEHPHVCKTPLQSLNMGRGRYERSSVACCLGDACRTTVPRFQPGLIKPNGKQCPACFATNLTLCGSAKVDCSGNENCCITTYQTIPVGDGLVTYYKKGCSTRALCYKRAGSYTKYVGVSNPPSRCIFAPYIKN